MKRLFSANREGYIPGLKELETFSHIHVLCWFHLSDSPELRAVWKRSNPSETLPRQDGQGLIEISYINAEDDTPIIDLKPYILPATG
jgi:tRNA (Thr-GGU) A37 N-methylase